MPSLGDTFWSTLLRFRWASPVEVQNYIDDTGVQVADVVVGFLRHGGPDPRRRESRGESGSEPFDYVPAGTSTARVGRLVRRRTAKRLEQRRQTLHDTLEAIEVNTEPEGGDGSPSSSTTDRFAVIWSTMARHRGSATTS